ncbi:hypothetical protein [Alteribacter populi]|uniref:hypothetical protein n=1 Tax=Alteribacter populi TaxID=2011011 RepID=UPI000BBAF6E7|nr:hypothetical protein [Alteribacter populi]
MKKATLSLSFICILVFLSGCLFPEESRTENQVPYDDQLQSVQTAVNQFREDSGVLPIKTRDEETPIFQKYPVEFRSLVPQYLQQAPGNSFENGGIFQYVLTNVEDEPEVKLIDLRSANGLQELSRRINQYRSQNNFAPVGELLGSNLLKLDYEALNFDEEPTVASPFHPTHELPVLLTTSGELVVDYRIDIQHFIDEYGMENYSEGEDLRWLLVDHSPFVPVHSKPITVKNGEVVFMKES